MGLQGSCMASGLLGTIHNLPYAAKYDGSVVGDVAQILQVKMNLNYPKEKTN
jgi:hypothetical protein